MRPRSRRAVLPTGGEGGAEGAADVGGVAEAADGVGEDGVVEADAGCVSAAQYCDIPFGQMEDAMARSRLGAFAEEPFALDSDDGAGDLDGCCFEVGLGPQHGEGFADAYAGAEHEGDQVGKVGLDGAFVGCQVLSEEGDFLNGQ